ncbi:MAG TPA: hypothetical protein VN088_00240 [Nocardioides sp.]|nr:hypothetical protein [Nocardioides sp.]
MLLVVAAGCLLVVGYGVVRIAMWAGDWPPDDEAARIGWPPGWSTIGTSAHNGSRTCIDVCASSIFSLRVPFTASYGPKEAASAYDQWLRTRGFVYDKAAGWWVSPDKQWDVENLIDVDSGTAPDPLVSIAVAD